MATGKASQSKSSSKSSPKAPSGKKDAAKAPKDAKLAKDTAPTNLKASEKGVEKNSEKNLGKGSEKKAGKAAVELPEISEHQTESELALLQARRAEEEDAEEERSAASVKSEAFDVSAESSNESNLSFKNFRHHPELENFYRFIYENDLRFEAVALLDRVLASRREHSPET